MTTGFVRSVVFLVIFSGCASAIPELKSPPEGLDWSPEAPFRHDKKIEIPAEANGLSHFLEGQLLLGEGNFEEALKEFEAARSEEHTSELQSPYDLVCRLLLEKK